MAREISRLERPHSKCSRSVSVILRMDNLLLVMWSSGKNLRGCHGYPAYRYVSNFTVQFDVESVSSLLWNGCPVCRGMRVQFEPEFAIARKATAAITIKTALNMLISRIVLVVQSESCDSTR